MTEKDLLEIIPSWAEMPYKVRLRPEFIVYESEEHDFENVMTDEVIEWMTLNNNFEDEWTIFNFCFAFRGHRLATYFKLRFG
jgi:hypothetical protein